MLYRARLLSKVPKMAQKILYHTDTNNMKLQLAIFFISIISFSASTVYAGERYEFYNGVRQTAMGGAGIGVANDETALLLNPAALGKLRNAYFTLVDPEVSVSGPFSQLILDGANPLDLFSLQGVVNSLNGEVDTPLHTQLQLFPSIVLQNFGIGILKKYSFNAISNSAGSSADITYFDDTAVVVGFNLRFFDGRIKFGFNGRYINRVYVNESILTNVASADASTYAKEGAGIASDVGLILTAPWATLPSISVVARDVGNTHYNINEGFTYNTTERPPNTVQTIDAAFSFFPIHGNNVRSSFSFEARDLTNVAEEKSASRRYHAGAELNIYDHLFLRAGYNQFYWTAGFEVAMEKLQIQLSSYAEDVGPDEAPIEDRRYVFKFVLRF